MTYAHNTEIPIDVHQIILSELTDNLEHNPYFLNFLQAKVKASYWQLTCEDQLIKGNNLSSSDVTAVIITVKQFVAGDSLLLTLTCYQEYTLLKMES